MRKRNSALVFDFLGRLDAEDVGRVLRKKTASRADEGVGPDPRTTDGDASRAGLNIICKKTLEHSKDVVTATWAVGVCADLLHHFCDFQLGFGRGFQHLFLLYL